jgi:hypothetical protein
MTAFFLVAFLGYSAFCWWVVFRDGAEVLEGWNAGWFFDWFSANLTASELRVGAVIAWLMALVIGLFAYFPSNRRKGCAA